MFKLQGAVRKLNCDVVTHHMTSCNLQSGPILFLGGRAKTRHFTAQNKKEFYFVNIDAYTKILGIARRQNSCLRNSLYFVCLPTIK
jgi:hypothetical protein